MNWKPICAVFLILPFLSFGQQLVDHFGNPSPRGHLETLATQVSRAGNCQNPCIIQQFNAPTTGTSELAWDGKNLWLTGYSALAIYRISPITGVVGKTIPTTVFRPYGLTFDGAHLWITDTDNELIHQVDTSNGNILATLPTPAASIATYPGGLTWDGVNLFHNDPKGTNGGSSSVDSTFYFRTNGAFLKGWLAYGDYPSGLAWDGARLWSSDNIADVFHEIDVGTFTSLRTVCVPQGTYPNGLAFDGTYLWYAENQFDRIYQLDPNNFNPVAAFDASDTTICAGDTIFFTNTSSGATIMHWSFPGGIVDSTNKHFPFVIYPSQGTYPVSLKISNCAGTDSVLKTNYITVGIGLNLSFSVANVNCGVSSGSIDLTVNGGVPPFDYAWSNGASTEDLLNIAPGSYSVTVSDAGGCEQVGTATVSGSVPFGPPDTCTWLGAINASWFEACNWDKLVVPDTSLTVLIPGGTSFQPVIAVDTGYCKDLVIHRFNGAKLYINHVSGGKLIKTP